MYSYLIGDEEHKKAKGVKKNVVKNEIRHNNYKDVLFNNKIIASPNEYYQIRITSG